MRVTSKIGGGVRTVVLLALLALALGACSTTPSSNDAGAVPSGCNVDPFVCAPGETCWPKDYAPTFACLKSAPGKSVQDPCANQPGVVTCSDNQACVEFSAGRGGCLSYCSDALHPCPGTQLCVEIKVGTSAESPSIKVCAPPKVDAGAPTELDGGSAVVDARIVDAVSELPN